MQKHTKAQDLQHETVVRRLKEREEQEELTQNGGSNRQQLYKLKAFQTVSPKIDTHNYRHQSKEGSVAQNGSMVGLPPKKLTKERFLSDLSREETMIDEVLRKSKSKVLQQGVSGRDSAQDLHLMKTIDHAK